MRRAWAIIAWSVLATVVSFQNCAQQVGVVTTDLPPAVDSAAQPAAPVVPAVPLVPTVSIEPVSPSIACADPTIAGHGAIIPISNAADLDNVRNNLGGNYQVVGDIDLSSIADWVPIGVALNPTDRYDISKNFEFCGTFDGNNKTIRNLRSSTGGLFGANVGVIKDTILANMNIAAVVAHAGGQASYVGGLVGILGFYNYISPQPVSNLSWPFLIDHCSVSGILSEEGLIMSLGGLIGWVTDGTVQNSSSAVTINLSGEGPNNGAGGLVGKTISLKAVPRILNCHSSGSLNFRLPATTTSSPPDVYLGGLVGIDTSITIQNSSSSVDISFDDESPYSPTLQRSLGGLLGVAMGNVTISHSQASGNIQGSWPAGPTDSHYYKRGAGGLIGSLGDSLDRVTSYSMSITDASASGNVSGVDPSAFISKLVMLNRDALRISRSTTSAGAIQIATGRSAVSLPPSLFLSSDLGAGGDVTICGSTAKGNQIDPSSSSYIAFSYKLTSFISTPSCP